MFQCSTRRLLEWQDGEHSGLTTSRESGSKVFFSSFLPFPFVILSFFWQDPDGCGSNAWITQRRHIIKSGSLQSPFFFITEETRESPKKWSTAIRQQGFPSLASGRPCPPSLNRAGPRWWPPHGSHLCPQQRRRSPAFHLTSDSPGKQRFLCLWPM